MSEQRAEAADRELMDQAFRGLIMRWAASTPFNVLAATFTFWLVDALVTGLVLSVVMLFGCIPHALVLTQRVSADDPRSLALYGLWAVASGLVPLVAMPGSEAGQYLLLLFALLSMPLAAFALSAKPVLASVWLASICVASVVAWSLADHIFASAIPQLSIIWLAPLSAMQAIESGRQQQHIVDASVQARLAGERDALTGTLRRTAFMEQVEDVLLLRQPACLFFIDIDRFKLINDTLSHQAGDQLLAAVAERLRGVLRNADLIGRMGGDEFAVCVEDVSRAGAMAIAQKLTSVFEHEFQLLQHRVAITASIGVVWSDGSSVSATELLHHTDTAMYAAKRDGASVRLFDEAMHDQLLREQDVELELRASLRRGEVSAHLQPIVNVELGRIVAYEALGRWSRKGKVIPAADFIVSAERSNLLPAVTRAVATELIDLTIALGPAESPRLGVNVEAGDLGPFLDWLADEPIDPSRWTVELTESQIVHNYADTERHVRRAAAMGLNVFLDDFGKAHSSLTRVLRLPITGLKLDASFVAEMQHNPTARAIVSSTVHLARECDLVVIAEGVETQDQVDALLAVGITLMQGYHFAPPASIAESTDLLTGSAIVL